ncbi:MAG: hypothetical protein NUW37_10415 [Planctomycetes bacterium]|nr:hypothetical protein [Planctomycetota bacterium]
MHVTCAVVGERTRIVLALKDLLKRYFPAALDFISDWPKTTEVFAQHPDREIIASLPGGGVRLG